MNTLLKITLQTILSCWLLASSTAWAERAHLDTTGHMDKIKVGCLFPLTGPGGRYGHDSVAAVKMAEEFLQRRYQERMPKLEVLIGDTRSKSLRAVQLARSFIDDNQVDFLCGVVSSSVALAVTEVSRKKRVFFIGTDHASPRLITQKLHPYYFRVNNGTRQSMRAGARYIRQHFKVKRRLRIAFIGPDYEYGYKAWEDLKAFLNQEQVEFSVEVELWPKLFETDYSAYIHTLMDSEPDIVINGHWGQDLVTFVKQAKGHSLFRRTRFMNFDAGGNYEVLAELGEEMPLGVVLSARHHLNWPNTEANRGFVEQFRERVGRYPSYAAEGAYAGILAIAEAVKHAGGLRDVDRLRIALENLRLKLPEDPDGFESYMDPESHQLLQVQAIGKTVSNMDYPPARVMLGDWSVYLPPKRWPTEIIETLTIPSP